MSNRRLAVENLSHSFGELSVLDDVSLTVGSGAFVGLVGPNGSGKTTVLELLAGIRSPQNGAVLRPDVARPVAYLPQSPSFRGGFTARETIQYYIDLAGLDADPDTYLEIVGLGDAADRPVEALSGGMTRLLGIAQTLISDPPVVLFDEPTSGLDPTMADRIFEVMEDLAAQDRILVVASHDLAALESHANRVVFLADGTVQLDGTPDRLLEETGATSLREAFIARLSSTAPESIDSQKPEVGR
jgi:ABC-type multidrug transport system ATPase subunit